MAYFPWNYSEAQLEALGMSHTECDACRGYEADQNMTELPDPNGDYEEGSYCQECAPKIRELLDSEHE